MRWPCKQRGRDLDELRDQGEQAAREAHETARRIEPTLVDLEKRHRRNGIYEEVLSTLRPRPRGTT